MKVNTRKTRLRGALLSVLCLGMLLCPMEVHAKEATPSDAQTQISSRILDLFLGKREVKEKTLYLCPGGQVFGMKIRQNGVTVTAIHDTESPIAKQLAVGDIILSLGGESVDGVTDLC